MSFPAAISSSFSIPRIRQTTDWSGNAKISDQSEQKFFDAVYRFRGDCGSSGRLRSLDRRATQSARRSSTQDHEKRAGERDTGALGESLAPQDATRGK